MAAKNSELNERRFWAKKSLERPKKERTLMCGELGFAIYISHFV